MCWSHPSLLFSNFTLQYMPLPLSDATQAYRSAPEKTDQALIKVRKQTNKHCRSIQAVACSLFVFSGALIGRLLVSEKYCAAEVETQAKRFQNRKKMHHEITLKSTHTHTHKCQVVFFTHVSDYWTVVLHIYFNEVLVKKSVSNFFCWCYERKLVFWPLSKKLLSCRTTRTFSTSLNQNKRLF